MIKNQLLDEARKAFKEKYAQTPEEAGYSVVRFWNNEIVFAKSEQVFVALQKGQKLIKIGLNSLLVIAAFFIIISIISAILPEMMPNDKFLFWTTLIGLLIFLGICTIILLKCNKWEAIYLEKDSHLIYNGKLFYAIEDNFNSNTAFF